MPINNKLLKAMRVAEGLPDDNYRLCAIITDKRGRILSVGQNSYQKSHPRQAYYAQKLGKHNKIFLHAELHALTRIPEDKKPHAIYIARVNKHGEPRNSKPCSICEMAIKDAGIQEIHYT